MSQAEQQEAEEGGRELRSGALGVIASVLRRFPAATDVAPLWPRFFTAAEPLLPRLMAEVSRCQARPPDRSCHQLPMRCIIL